MTTKAYIFASLFSVAVFILSFGIVASQEVILEGYYLLALGVASFFTVFFFWIAACIDW